MTNLTLAGVLTTQLVTHHGTGTPVPANVTVISMLNACRRATSTTMFAPAIAHGATFAP